MNAEMSLVSVIVPVYNVEKYVKRCIESIIEQSFRNLQIILVDDGSTDSSGKICDDMREMDKRIEVYHIENRGLSGARNYGIKHIKGEYVVFVDSDDFIGKSHIENLYSALINEPKAHLSVTSYTRFYEGQAEIEPLPSEEECCTFSPIEALAIATDISDRKCFQEYAWGKMYDKSLFPLIVFPEGKLYEDRYICYKIILNSEAIAYENSNDYFYLCNRSGSITNSRDLKHLDCLNATKSMMDYTERSFHDAYPIAYARYCSELFSFFGLAVSEKDYKVANTLYSDILATRNKALSCPTVHRTTKIGFLLTYFGKTVCKAAIRANDSAIRAIKEIKKQKALHAQKH